MEGKELVVRGFPTWTRKRVIETWVKDDVLTAIDVDLAEDVESIFAPGPRGQIALLKVLDQGSVENRALMFSIVKAINANKQKMKDDEGEEGTFWAGPSKPVHIRKQDQLVTQAMSVARLTVPKSENLEHDFPCQGSGAD